MRGSQLGVQFKLSEARKFVDNSFHRVQTGVGLLEECANHSLALGINHLSLQLAHSFVKGGKLGGHLLIFLPPGIDLVP